MRPSSILARKARPTATPARTSQRRDAVVVARTVAYAPAVMSRTMTASGLSKRNIITATGVRAIAVPATSPAVRPASRVTAAYTSATDATPMSASGTRIDALENPKSRADRPITHCDTGGLSTVMKFEGSSEPKSSASSCVTRPRPPRRRTSSPCR